MRNVTKLMASLGAAFILSSSMVWADEIVMRDGRVLVGQVRSSQDGKVVFERTYGLLTLDQKNIHKITRQKNDIFDRYDSLAANAKNDAGKTLQLANWCKTKGLNYRMRYHAKELVSQNKDHAGAHHLLGQVKFGDQWMSKSSAFRKQGRVRNNGVWLSAAKTKTNRQVAKEKARMRRLQRRMNSYVRGIYSSSAKTSERYYLKLLNFAAKEKVDGLKPAAARFYRDAAKQRQLMASGLVTVRLQQASLTGLRNRTIGLGNGGNVRIQLPETKLIGIGTTVGVPLR